MTMQPSISNSVHEKPSESPINSTEDELLNKFLSSPTPKRLIKGVVVSQSGDKLVSEYQIGGFLGKGAFAKCYKMMEVASGKVYAGKVIEKARLTKPNAKQKLSAEIKIHRSLKHPHIVAFHAFFQDSQNFYIILEMCNQKTLKDLLKARKTLTEVEVRYFLAQCLDAVQYLHSQNIIHRDLKLENILIHNMKIKIGDFGLAVQLKDPTEKRRALCGTPNYIAPEVLDTEQGHSFEVDIWACGVILYSLLVGKPPFETNSVEETYRRIRTNTYSFPEKRPLSEEAKNLIRRLLHPNPQCRPKIPEILSDPFFNGKYIPRALSSRYLTEEPQQNENLTPKKTPLSNKKRKFGDVGPQNHEVGCGLPSSKVAKFDLHECRRHAIEPATNSIHNVSSSVIDQLRLMCDRITRFISGRHDGSDNKENQMPLVNSENTSSQQQQQQQQQVETNIPTKDLLLGGPHQYWISKWVDFSRKFGLGYQFCDGAVGVSFNDGTHIIANIHNGRMEFFDKPNNYQKQILDRNASYSNNPKVKKRITLWKVFRNHLLSCGESQGLELLVNDSLSNKDSDLSTKSTETKLDEQNCQEDLIFVRHWQRRKHAIVFHFSNNTFQINFVDHTKIIITPFAKYIIYVNKKGNRITLSTSPSEPPPDNSNEIMSRVRYAKDCITQAIQTMTSTN